MSSRILAIHLSPRRICTAVAEASIGALRVTEIADRRLGGDTAGEAARLVPPGPWDRVLATLSADAALYRFLELPFRDRRRLALAVGPALEEHVPLSLDEAETAFDLTSSTRDAAPHTVLAAMAPRTTLEAQRARIGELGVPPQRLLWAPSVTLEVYRRVASGGTTDGFTAVDLSADGAVIGTFEGDRLRDLHVVGPCDDELLLRNVVFSLRSLELPGERVIVGGPGAALLLESRATPDLRIEPLPLRCPLEAVTGTEWRDATPAVGLLYAAAGQLSRPVIDFSRQGSGAISAVADLREELRPLVPWAAAAIVFALLAGGADYLRLARQRGALEREVAGVYQEVMPGDAAAGGARLKMEMRLRELTGRRQELAGAGGGDSPLRVLAALSHAVPDDIDIQVNELSHVPPTVRLSGHGGSFESVTRLQQELSASGRFAGVEVKDVHAAVRGTGVDFQLVLTLGAAEPPAAGEEGGA